MKKELDVELPMGVNFIKVGGEFVPVEDFTEIELRQIGHEWTENLIENAKRRRTK